MSDLLSPIRRLYAEPPDTEGGGEPDHMSSAQKAEFSALRPVREALDRLPRQRPPRSVVDATVARATFAAVRNLYGEPVDAPLSEADARESAALAGVKQALDELPPESPEPAVVDSVVARAVVADVRSLYDEDPPEVVPDEVAREAAALAPVKHALDALPREKPDPKLIDSVVAMAATADASRRRSRRRPVAPARGAVRGRRRRVVALAGALGGAFLIALAALWTMQGSDAERIVGSDGPDATDEWIAAVPEESTPPPAIEPEPAPQAPREQPQQGLAATAPVSSPVGGRPAARPTAEPARSAAEQLAMHVEAAPIPPARHTALPTTAVDLEHDVILAGAEFEAGDEALRLLYLRLQALRAAGMAWDEAGTVLGAVPVSLPAAAHGWMQVRTER